ncbi:hypothetical protein AURDEDRAFT_28202, partial [Auricularia subglabra TFB-10046 SS5]
DNYCIDLKAAKRLLMRGGRYPAFPDALWETVLADKAVDFDKLLSAQYAAAKSGTDHPWIRCFTKWNNAVCFAYPHRVQELQVYRDFIERQFDTIHEDFHERVIRADAAIREEVSNDPGLSFFDKEELRDIGARHISPIG